MTKAELITYIEENVYINNNKEVTAIDFQNTFKEVVNFVPDITDLQGDVSTAQSDITTLQGDVSTAQGDITTLQGDVSTAQGDITILQGDVVVVKDDITDLQGDVSTAQSYITDLQGDVDVAKDDITDLQGDVSTAQSYITDLQDDVDIVQNDIVTLQNTVNERKISEFSPAISNIVGAFTANPAIIKAFYIKMGNYVKCEVLFSCQASSTGTKGFELSLPIASNFSDIRDAVGFGVTNTATTASAIANYYLCAETTNNTIKIQFFTSATQTYEASLSFIYKII